MQPGLRVTVISSHHLFRVDRRRDRALVDAVSGAWGIKQCDIATPAPHKSMEDAVPVIVVSRDYPTLVDGNREGPGAARTCG